MNNDYWQINMQKGVTSLSRDIYDLHMIALYVCAGIGLIVFGIMLYILVYHRKADKSKAKFFHKHFASEIIWATIPFGIVLMLAIPATKALLKSQDESLAEVTIKITGSQWKWQYQYLKEGINFFSVLATPYSQIQNKTSKNRWYLLEVDKPLVLPINKKIKFLITSSDVIHAWWVPELGIKTKAIPGKITQAWVKIDKPGTYRGQCAQFCGVNHGFMPIVVKAISENDYKVWLTYQPQSNKNKISFAILTPRTMSKTELMTLGKSKYETNCLACHQADGRGIPPMFPALKGNPVVISDKIKRHVEIILNGVPKSAMQPYAKQLTDEEIAAIATYESNALGNNANKLIQPQEVAKIRSDNNIFLNAKLRNMP